MIVISKTQREDLPGAGDQLELGIDSGTIEIKEIFSILPGGNALPDDFADKNINTYNFASNNVVTAFDMVLDKKTDRAQKSVARSSIAAMAKLGEFSNMKKEDKETLLHSALEADKDKRKDVRFLLYSLAVGGALDGADEEFHGRVLSFFEELITSDSYDDTEKTHSERFFSDLILKGKLEYSNVPDVLWNSLRKTIDVGTGATMQMAFLMPVLLDKYHDQCPESCLKKIVKMLVERNSSRIVDRYIAMVLLRRRGDATGYMLQKMGFDSNVEAKLVQIGKHANK